MKTTILATAMAVALLTGGCAEMKSWMPSGDTGATASTSGSRYATEAGAVNVPDPAGTATEGTGSSSGNDAQQRQAYSTGAGLD
jgi:hypothetical protein